MVAVSPGRSVSPFGDVEELPMWRVYVHSALIACGVAVATTLAAGRERDALVLVLAADHVIAKPEAFREACREAAAAAAAARVIVTERMVFPLVVRSVSEPVTVSDGSDRRDSTSSTRCSMCHPPSFSRSCCRAPSRSPTRGSARARDGASPRLRHVRPRVASGAPPRARRR